MLLALESHRSWLQATRSHDINTNLIRDSEVAFSKTEKGVVCFHEKGWVYVRYFTDACLYGLGTDSTFPNASWNWTPPELLYPADSLLKNIMSTVNTPLRVTIEMQLCQQNNILTELLDAKRKYCHIKHLISSDEQQVHLIEFLHQVSFFQNVPTIC